MRISGFGRSILKIQGVPGRNDGTVIKGHKMKSRFEIVMAIPAELAWVAAGEKFGETGQWTSFLDSSHMEGAVEVGGYRVCIDGKKTLTEQLTKFDPVNMVLEYELTGGRPPILKSAKNHWFVESLGPNRSKLVMIPTMEFKWWAVFLKPVLLLSIRVILPKVLEEFKHWAETGEAHPRKKARAA